MSLAEIMIAGFAHPLWFSQFGEPVIYTSFADGLQHQLIAGIKPADGSLTAANGEEKMVEEIDVRIGRLAGQLAGGLEIGGIPLPQLRDTLVRSGEAAPLPYSFDHERRQTSTTWLLRFRRRRVVQLGTDQQQRVG